MLIYFDIFQFPLHHHELSLTTGTTALNDELEWLHQKQFIQADGGYYKLGSSNYDITKRVEIKDTLSKYFRKAEKYSLKISKFPFVRGVYISGSLSKGWADKNSDIDYFIITEPHRLWICRLLLVMYKKTFLFNSRKHFCVNYFIDTDHLAIPDENIFTATEICFLKPMINPGLYDEFIARNQWIYRHFSSLAHASGGAVRPLKNTRTKRMLEKLFAGRLGEWADKKAFQLTLRRWRKKFRDFNEEDFDLNMRSKKHVSKHHPQGFQKKVLDAYDEKIRIFEETYNVQLS